jgi:hypothetical protein
VSKVTIHPLASRYTPHKSIIVVLCTFLTLALLHPQPDIGADTAYIQWDPPQQISFDSYNSASPRIVAVGDTVHLMWTTSNGPVVFYARSTNIGTSWSEPVVLDDTTNSVTLSAGEFSAASRYGYVFWTRCEPPCTLGNIHRVIDLRRTVDAGTTWLPRTTTVSDAGTNTVTYSAARDTIVAFTTHRTGDHYRFRLSWDSGVSWSFYNLDSLGDGERFVLLGNGVHLVRSLFRIGLPNFEVGYFCSSDYGQSWTPRMFLSSPDSILSDQPDIAGDDDGSLYAVWRDFKYGGSFDGTILFRRSTDSGQTWQRETRLTVFPSGNFPRVSTKGPFVAVLWGDTIGGVVVRVSVDYGATFFPPQLVVNGGNGISDLSLPYIHIAYRVNVGGSNGEIFYRRGRIITTMVGESSMLPSVFMLFQNYPNPFNTQTVFRFSLPHQTHVRLSIYDVLGRNLGVILDETMEQGTHAVPYIPSHLASGIYFYRFQTAEFHDVKKCLLLK